MRTSDQKLLAVKMIVNKSLSSGQIPPAEETLERELRMSTLHLIQHNNGHPNVTKTVDFFAWQGARLLVMEFAACANLEEYMHTVLPHALDEETGRTIMVQVWRGLKWLHENDVSYGDLTAANVLLRLLHPSDCVISDFGESRKGRMQTTLPGTLVYMAPEVARIYLHGGDGYEYDAQRTDVWSTGVLASRILTLKLPPIPSDGKWLAMFATLRGWSPTFEGLSENCSTLLLRILSYDSSRRPSAAQCLDTTGMWTTHMNSPMTNVRAARLCGLMHLAASLPEERMLSSGRMTFIQTSRDYTLHRRAAYRTLLYPASVAFLRRQRLLQCHHRDTTCGQGTLERLEITVKFY
ncbi:unnamed protein product [Zymoseptoria tritici ST99CH_1A5]|uniref:EKC/KEOPS complex subunit BUD32 n=1 Tax=Zymoseptoria tritici ST99CH_1A5 TaxID=1276529 RepID=A0A1Y6M3D1_ZYMTR|nr:unnamed protein product [Zymoseptoria tritici ST99CH_1A5]